MPIRTGRQFGSVIATMQGQTTDAKSASTASVSSIQRNYDGGGKDAQSASAIFDGDEVNTQSSNGSLSDYTNPDLESVLSSIGFSTMRPEMLAAFEFQPFLDESAIKSGSSSLSEKNLSTTAAEYFTVHIDQEEIGRLYAGDWMFMPWNATSGTKALFIIR